jgi:hypothetical protein
VADVTQSNVEIKARFETPLTIEPNSKIALLNCRTRFPTLESEGGFTIISNPTLGVVNNLFTVDGTQISIPAGTYSTAQFENLLEVLIALNVGSAASPFILSILGTDYRVSTTPDGKFSLTKQASRNALANWEANWIPEGGNPDLSTDGTFVSDAGAGPFSPDIVQSNTNIPNAAFGCNATVSAFSAGPNKSWRIGAVDGQLTVYGIGVDSAGNYAYYHFSGTGQAFSDGTLAPTTTPLANDNISITRQGDSVIYTVRRGGTVILQADETVSFSQQEIRFLNNFPVAQIFSVDDGLTLTNLKFTVQELLPQLLRNYPTSISMSFGSASLAKYLGFPGLGPFTASGTPAVLTATNQLDPDEKAVGILVVVDPLVLDSYDGDSRPTTKKGRDSIVAVLNQEGSLGKTFILDVNFPVALGIKNANNSAINQLSIRFKDGSNGQILVFDKDTVVTLLIYGPNESP